MKALNNGHALILLLVVQAKQVVETSVDFNGEFIARMIPKLDWRVLKSAAESVSLLPLVCTNACGPSVNNVQLSGCIYTVAVCTTLSWFVLPR